MKPSRNLLIFSLVALVATIVFDQLYNNWINTVNEPRLGWLGFGFGMVLFVSGLVLGASDKQRKVRYDLGFAYHFATYLIVSGVSLISTLMRGYPLFAFESSEQVQSITVPWVVLWGLLGVFPHYLASRHTIKGIDKKDLFK